MMTRVGYFAGQGKKTKFHKPSSADEKRPACGAKGDHFIASDISDLLTRNRCSKCFPSK